jgi:plasmid stability protein
MASITIRDLEPELKERLRVRAARNQRSMEEEARVILRGAMSSTSPPSRNLGDAIHRRFRDIGLDLQIAPRTTGREPPKFR